MGPHNLLPRNNWGVGRGVLVSPQALKVIIGPALPFLAQPASQEETEGRKESRAQSLEFQKERCPRNQTN